MGRPGDWFPIYEAACRDEVLICTLTRSASR